MFAKILAFLKVLLPFATHAKGAADKVAPDIQRAIDHILAEAKEKVEGLKANHSFASIQKQMDDDIAAVRETAEHHVALIKQLAEAKLGAVSKRLPDVASQLGLTVVGGALSPTQEPDPAHPPTPFTQ